MSEERKAEGYLVRTAHGAVVRNPGFGSWELRDGQARAMVEKALDLGYRRLDTAEAYGNEKEIGEALMAGDLSRWDLFLASKVSPSHFAHGDFRQAVRASLDRLRIEGEVESLHGLHEPTGRIIDPDEDAPDRD